MVELKYFERSDFRQLINWVDSPEFLLQWGGPGFAYPLDESQLEKYIEKANDVNSDTFVYKVIHKETANVVGHISLGKIDRKNMSARVGKVLVGDKNTRRQGIGQLMMAKILKVAFDELNLHKLKGECNFALHNHSNEAVSFELEFLDSYFMDDGIRMESLMNLAGPYRL